VAPASFSVWQSLHPAVRKTCFPAVELPAAAPPPCVVVAGVVEPGVVVPAAVVVAASLPEGSALDSLPKTSTALSIATKKRTHTVAYQPMCLPGKFGLPRGRRNDEMSANAMKRPATTARPISWAVERAATTRSIEDTIAAGTYRKPLLGGR